MRDGLFPLARLVQFLGKRRPAKRCQPRRNRLQLQLEPLETRNLLASVLTYHNDDAKTGQNLAETVLTRANVNVNTFGKVFSVTLDGDIYTQPLVKEDVNITLGPNTLVASAGIRDVVFVATQHGSLYAIDAKAHSSGGQGVVLWKRNMLDTKLPGATSIGPALREDIGAGYIETTTTGTPVIDAATNTLYILTKSREIIGGKVHLTQRMHAVNISDGTAKVAPFLIGDTVHNGNEVYVNNSPVWVNGTGDGNDGQGHVYFNAIRAHTRTALTLFNGVVYAGWASHESRGPYHGWVIGFDADNLALRTVFCTTPNGGLGGIWQSGGGLATDGNALYFMTSNGTFDGNNGNLVSPSETGTVTGLDANGFPIEGNYSNSIVKVVPDPNSNVNNQHLNGWGLKVVDYFTPFNQKFLEERDLDLGSGAPMILPDEAGSAAHPHLLVGAGKEGIMYLIDRDNMGKFGTKNRNVQTVGGQLSGSFDTPAYYKNSIYYVEGFGGTAKTFSINNGVMSAVPTSRSLDTYAYAGSTPSISANGTSNGIVWDVDRGTNQLRAYSTDSYASLLYHSGQAAGNRDRLGAAATFQVPTVANGHVYLGTASGASSTLVAYGLIQPPTAKPAAPSNLRAVSISGTQVNLSWQANDTSPNIATGYLLQKSADGGATWTAVSSGIATTFAVGGLETSTAYKFRVAAVNSIGNSAFSNVLSVTTTANAGGVDFSEGFDGTTGSVLELNGAAVTGGALVLTNGAVSKFQGVFAKVKQDITKFSSSFDFHINGGPSANGFTFTIQSDTPKGDSGGWQAAGGDGLAYGSVNNVVFPHSIALKFDLFRPFDLYENSGDNISTTGLYFNGAMPTTPEFNMASQGIDLHSGHRMRAVINYDFATRKLSLTVIDTVSNGQFSKVFDNVDVPAAVGGGSAYVGFTAASGRSPATAATQRILNWKFAPAGPPNAPTGLHTLVTGQVPGTDYGTDGPPPLSVILSWEPVADVTGYTIERRFGLVGNYDVLASVGPNATSYTNVNVATQTDYYYRIRASNDAGDSAFSAEAVATTPGRVPTPRFGEATLITPTSIALKWMDLATNEIGYHIVRRAGSSPYTLVAALPAHPGKGAMTFVDSGLDPGTEDYDYHIQAIGLPGYADYTGVNADTPPQSGAPRAFFKYVSTPRSSAVDEIVVNFSQGVTGFGKNDLRLTRNGASVSLASATLTQIDDRTWSLNLAGQTAADGNYRLALAAAAAGIKNAANVALTTGAEVSWKKDTAPPTVVSLTQVTPAAGVQLTNVARVVYRLQFSEPVLPVAVRMMLSIGLSSHDPVITTTDNKTYTIAINQLVGEGTLALELNDATNPIRDIAGNALPPEEYPQALTIRVDRLPPAIAAKTVLLEKNVELVLDSTQLLSSDTRVGADSVIYTVKSLPEHVLLAVGGIALEVGDTFSQLDINTRHVTVKHDLTDDASDEMTFTVSDGLNTTVVRKLFFALTPTNVAPLLPAVPLQTASRNTPLFLTGISVVDPDAGQTKLQLSLSVRSGFVTLSSISGLTFSEGGPTMANSMIFTGTLQDINKALANLRFMPQSGFSGNDLIKLAVNDQGQGGTRVEKSASRQLTVPVTATMADPTTLKLAGGWGADNLAINVSETLVTFFVAGTSFRYPRGVLTTIDVSGYGGNDKFAINSTNGLLVIARGGDGNDTITVASAVTSQVRLLGEVGNDTLAGGGGDDILDGGLGDDRLAGGNGSDRYVFRNAGATEETDTVAEFPNGGLDTLDFAAVTDAIIVDLRSDQSLATQPRRKVVTDVAGQRAQFEGVIGGSGNDILRGNDGDNFLSGSAGNDVLMGYKGTDKLFAGDGDDILTGGNGNDTMGGGNGNDTYMFASVGSGPLETDTVSEFADAGLDTLDFSGVTTAVAVNLAEETLATHENRTVVTAAAGQSANFENAIGGAGNDTLRGNAAANVLRGNAGRDLLLGFAGWDTLFGGDDDDRLAGGDGNDTLIAGGGNDGYEFADVTNDTAETDTVIELANQGTDDHLDFRGVTTPVTVTLGGSTLARHALRTVIRGTAAEIESSLVNPPGAAAAPTSGGSPTPRAPNHTAQVDQWMAGVTADDEWDELS